MRELPDRARRPTVVRTMLRVLAIAIALVVTAAACGDDDSEVGTGDDGSGGGGGDLVLDGRAFLSTGVTQDGADRPLVEGTQIRLSFEDGTMSASAGCNSGGGPYSLDGDVLVVESLAVTEMGCDPPRHDQDEWLFDLLGARPAVAVSGDELTVSTASTRITLLDREVADPDRPLVGTDWTASGFIEGETASSTAIDSPGTIRFADDGTVTGADGCLGFTGTYTLDEAGGDVAVHGLDALDHDVATEGCGAEVDAYAQQFGAIFAADVTATIEAGNLTLLAPDGRGVTFVAG